MNCDDIRELLGPLLDGELASDAAAEVASHAQSCSDCGVELQRLRDLASSLSVGVGATVPDNLWTSIEQRLDSAPRDRMGGVGPQRVFIHRKRWALAASVVVAIGVGLAGLTLTGRRAVASTVDFRVLLDGLSVDARKAFGKFLVLYDARPGSPREALRFAPSLDFATPEMLPGGFQLDGVYLLRFGDSPGIAASYQRGDEFLATIFHPPVGREDFGSHKDYPCVVGRHHGHKVEVGAWTMVHLTDATTCHCVLSQLDEQTELPAVMAAVAPNGYDGNGHAQDHHN